ncbi:ER membrane protein DP1/Yop1 [Oleoguttula sp. CCFEE 5521]|uniref:Protein YOP1 n=1 Tax=Cryoendolithus antarcticus TaxID=1507870 RepID=A0A1V8SWR0_9PEZI|nr:Protein yop1 [Cryoendolithus antarcticus]OQO04488.1 Protein yop1 [Cryoendolithus antarcticus]OQO18254.1 Protein yop1 [Rachicladosporium sp. CCFEE 5018]
MSQSGSIQEKAQYHLSQLDKSLSKYPQLQQFEQQTSVPKVYVVLGLGALYFFLIFFNIAGEFLVNTAGFVIPAYYSLDALFTSGKADDTQWLTYWVTYAFLTVIESAVNAVYWFPFYYTFKFILVLWMALPQTGGAQIVFRSLLQPLFSRFFSQGNSASTSANLRASASQATGQATGKAS